MFDNGKSIASKVASFYLHGTYGLMEEQMLIKQLINNQIHNNKLINAWDVMRIFISRDWKTFEKSFLRKSRFDLTFILMVCVTQSSLFIN